MCKLRKHRFLYLILGAALFSALESSRATNPEASRLIGKGDYEAAYQVLLSDLDRSPNDESTLYWLGLTAPEGNRSSLFLKEYLQKFDNGRHMEEVRRQLLEYYAAAGLEITAGQLYSDGRPEEKRPPEDLYRAGLIYQHLGRYDEAARLFGFAMEGAGDEMAAWCRLGLADCSLLKGDYSDAESRYRELAENDPDSQPFPFSLIGLSETYRRDGDLDKSALYYQLYRDRFELAPGSAEIEAAILDREPNKSDENLPGLLDLEYFIQVGIFARKDNAKKCMKKFRNMGYRSRMEKVDQNGKEFFRTMVGPYDNEKSARHDKTDLERSQGEEYLIILK